MAALDLVRFEEHAGGIGVIAMIDRASNNAMSPDFVDAFTAEMRRATACKGLRVLVLRGLEEVFSSGASAEMLSALAEGEVEPTEIVLPKIVLDCPVPVIAAMEGHAVGGGFALGLCADIVVLAKESRYGVTFMNMGFTPGMGTTRLLEHVLSPAIAAELLFTGETKKGSFFERGVNMVLPRAEVFSYAMSIAARIADKPRVALELLKRTLSLPRRQAFEATHTLESLMHRVTFAQEDILQKIREGSP
jgi:polyketide biosynthesis enoyl-CoA hydratase PksI